MIKSEKKQIRLLTLVGIIFAAAVGMAVIAGILFSILRSTEKAFSAYRTDAEIKLSELQKDNNGTKKDIKKLEDELALAEKSKQELMSHIAEVEAEINALKSGMSNTDELYSTLETKLKELSDKLTEKESEVQTLKKEISLLKAGGNVDLNEQYKLITRLEKLLSEGAPLKKKETIVLSENGSPVIGADGLALKQTSYVYPSVSVLYYDLTNGYTYSKNENTVYSAEGLINAPFALTVLSEAAKEKEAYDKKVAELIAEKGENAVIPAFKPVFDLQKIFTYTADKARPGDGVIKNDEFGTEYTYRELFDLLLKYGDTVAFSELSDEYGLKMLKKTAEKLGAVEMKNDVNKASAADILKFMKEIYTFTEGGNEYSALMKDAMMSSIQSVMIGNGVAPKKLAHQYGYGVGSYHDMAIVYDDHPYILVIMTDMDGGKEQTEYISSVAKQINEIHENFYK